MACRHSAERHPGPHPTLSSRRPHRGIPRTSGLPRGRDAADQHRASLHPWLADRRLDRPVDHPCRRGHGLTSGEPSRTLRFIRTSGSLIKSGPSIGIGTENTVWLTVVAFILGVLGYLGWSFLPSNGDSLVYHLVRVVHWIQDQSVGPFATHYVAQIELSPLAEFNLAHFHLLVGSDRLDAYVQLLACIICLVAVSEIARLLGGSRWTQVGGGRHLRDDPVGHSCGHQYRERLLRRGNRHRVARHRPRLAVCRLMVVSGIDAGIGRWPQLPGQGHSGRAHRPSRRVRPPGHT